MDNQIFNIFLLDMSGSDEVGMKEKIRYNIKNSAEFLQFILKSRC